METEPDASRPRGMRRNRNSKACTNCARVKCKCLQSADGASCERCRRLGKTCVPSASSKQRGPKRGAASRSARIEEKLDDLVTLLRGRQMQAIPHQADSTNIGFEQGDRADSPSPSLGSTPSADEDYADEPSSAVAEESLTRFRKEMIVLTPYVYIPPEMTSVQVQQRYPFLWLNIMATASKSVETRNSLSLQTRRIIIERIVAGGERSLDLLFGVLTFVNWVHLFPMDKQFACLASQLAVSLVWDLGLQMPPPEHPARFPPDVSVASKLEQSVRKERTVEEQRAVLGAFVITSALSQTLKSVDGFRWSPYLDEYLANISQHSTVPQDQVLTRQVRMQLIVNQIRYSSGKISRMEFPTSWVDNLQVQLDGITSAAHRNSSAFGSESILLWFYYYATLVIREWITVKSSSPRNEPELTRYEVYQRCVNSIQAWLDLFFSMPLQMYASVPCSIYCQLCYVVLFLRQITTIRDTAWNSAAALQVVDPLQTVDRIIHTFEQVKAADVTHASSIGEDQAIYLGIKKFQFLKSAWQNESASQFQAQDAFRETEMPNGVQTLSLDETMDIYSCHMLPNALDGIPWR